MTANTSESTAVGRLTVRARVTVWKSDVRNLSCRVRARSDCSRNRRHTISDSRASMASNAC